MATEIRDASEIPIPNELIVDRRHKDVVAKVLSRDLGVWPASPSAADLEANADLDLVLLRNLDLTGYAEAARARFRNELAALETEEDIDVLVYDLRRRFGREHGFVPVMGKNRDAVLGYPQHKAGPDPEPIGEPVVIPDGTAGSGVRIGIVDTPLAPHVLLPDHLVEHDGDVVATSPAPSPWAGHATFVAGLIRQQAPGAKLLVRAGLAADDGRSSTWTVAKTIASFRKSDIHVLNLSLGCRTADGAPPMVMERALEVLPPEVFVVAAAGNRRAALRAEDRREIWPAAATDVLAVGAAGAGFSMDERWVDVDAPGLDVISTYLAAKVTLASGQVESFGGFAKWSGTSFAAATVAGSIAARMSTDDVGPVEALERLRERQGSEITPHHHQPARG